MCFFKFKNFIPYGNCLIRFDILISNWTQQRHWWSLWCLTTKSFASLIRSHNMFQLCDFCFSSVSTIILLFQMFFSRLYLLALPIYVLCEFEKYEKSLLSPFWLWKEYIEWKIVIHEIFMCTFLKDTSHMGCVFFYIYSMLAPK